MVGGGERPRRIVIEEVEKSSLVIPGQKPTPGGWKVSEETSKTVPEDEFAQVMLTITCSAIIPRLLSENARLKAQVAMLSASTLAKVGMGN